MGIKRKLIRCLSKATCDKHDLNKMVLKYKKRFLEACSALDEKKKK